MAWLDAPPATALIFLLLFSSPVIGSFLGVVASRVPEGRSVVWPGSHCEACGTPLKPWDLIPLVSFVALAGRCRYCQGAIPVGLPLLEALCLLAAAWVFIALGPQASLGAILASFLLGYALLALSAVDVRAYFLPDTITLPLAITGLGISLLLGTDRFVQDGLAAAIGYGMVWGLRALYFRWRGREGIGLGDAKLMLAAGAWVGPWGLPSVLLLGSLSGLVLAGALALSGRSIRTQTALPFGPFLALGIWLVWLYGPMPFGTLVAPSAF